MQHNLSRGFTRFGIPTLKLGSRTSGREMVIISALIHQTATVDIEDLACDEVCSIRNQE